MKTCEHNEFTRSKLNSEIKKASREGDRKMEQVIEHMSIRGLGFIALIYT